MEEEKIYCSHCGDVIEGDDYDTIYGEPSVRTALTDTQQSATGAKKSYGTMMFTAMKIYAYVLTAMRTTIHAVRNATVSFTMTMHTNSTTDTSAMNVIRESAEMHQSMNMVTNLNRFSMVIQAVISV